MLHNCIFLLSSPVIHLAGAFDLPSTFLSPFFYFTRWNNGWGTEGEVEKIFRNGGYFEIFNLDTAGDFSLVQCHDRTTIKTIFIYTLHLTISSFKHFKGHCNLDYKWLIVRSAFVENNLIYWENIEGSPYWIFAFQNLCLFAFFQGFAFPSFRCKPTS